MGLLSIVKVATSKGVKSPECANVNCGHDAGCRAAPGGGFICVCDYHGTIKEELGKRCVLPEETFIQTETTTNDLNVTIQDKSSFKTRHQTASIFFGDDAVRRGINDVQQAGQYWLLSTTVVLTVAAVFILIILWLKMCKKNQLPCLAHFSARFLRTGRRPLRSQSVGSNRSRVMFRSGRTNERRVDKDDPGELIGEDGDTEIAALMNVNIIQPDCIKLGKEIGGGHFGQVFRASLLTKKATVDGQQEIKTELVAVKAIGFETIGLAACDELMHEAKIMAAFDHPNILALRGVVFNHPPTGPWLVSEYMAEGDLLQLLRAKRDAKLELSKEDSLSIAVQIAAGMKYLWSKRFVHRDLASRNCLVGIRQSPSTGGDVQSTAKPKNELILKISDFGMTRKLYSCDYYTVGGGLLKKLPVRWMAPESLRIPHKFTSESDVWSYGVLLWEIYCLGDQPYGGHSNEEALIVIRDNHTKLQPPAGTPLFICQLMNEGCWDLNPAGRLNFKQIHSKLQTEITTRKGKPEITITIPSPASATINFEAILSQNEAQYEL